MRSDKYRASNGSDQLWRRVVPFGTYTTGPPFIREWNRNVMKMRRRRVKVAPHKWYILDKVMTRREHHFGFRILYKQCITFWLWCAGCLFLTYITTSVHTHHGVLGVFCNMVSLLLPCWVYLVSQENISFFFFLSNKKKIYLLLNITNRQPRRPIKSNYGCQNCEAR